MFPLSKIIFLGALLTSSSGLAIFLLPYLLLKRDKKLKTLLQTSNSEYKNRDSEIFIDEENKKLQKSNISFKYMKEAKENTKELQRRKNNLILKIFEDILKVEDQIIKIYSKNKEVLKKLQDNFDNYANQQKLSSQILSQIQFLNHSLSLMIQMRDMFWAQGDALGKFICFIDGKGEEGKCEESKNNWITLASSAGGGGSPKKLLVN